MVRWAQESVIEDPELVRAMFVLLHRQYDGIGGQVGLCVCVFLLMDMPLKTLFTSLHQNMTRWGLMVICILLI